MDAVFHAPMFALKAYALLNACEPTTRGGPHRAAPSANRAGRATPTPRKRRGAMQRVAAYNHATKCASSHGAVASQNASHAQPSLLDLFCADAGGETGGRVKEILTSYDTRRDGYYISVLPATERLTSSPAALAHMCPGTGPLLPRGSFSPHLAPRLLAQGHCRVRTSVARCDVRDGGRVHTAFMFDTDAVFQPPMFLLNAFAL